MENRTALITGASGGLGLEFADYKQDCEKDESLKVLKEESGCPVL